MSPSRVRCWLFGHLWGAWLLCRDGIRRRWCKCVDLLRGLVLFFADCASDAAERLVR